MRILILGADGMIGHKIAQSLEDFELILASRKSISSKSIGIIRGKMVLHNLITDSLDLLLDNTTPDIIINCAGITTRRGVEDNIVNTNEINGTFFQTENEYTVLVYYKAAGSLYDRVIGVGQGYFNQNR